MKKTEGNTKQKKDNLQALVVRERKEEEGDCEWQGGGNKNFIRAMIPWKEKRSEGKETALLVNIAEKDEEGAREYGSDQGLRDHGQDIRPLRREGWGKQKKKTIGEESWLQNGKPRRENVIKPQPEGFTKSFSKKKEGGSSL